MPPDIVYSLKSAIRYQFAADAWKMSVTSLSTIWGISSPSISFSSFEESKSSNAENVYFHDMLSSTALVKRTLTVMVNRFNRAVSDEPETEAVVEV